MEIQEPKVKKEINLEKINIELSESEWDLILNGLGEIATGSLFSEEQIAKAEALHKKVVKILNER